MASFAFFALINALGISLAFSDFGISKIVFLELSKLRFEGAAAYTSHELRGRSKSYVAGIFLLFALVISLCTLLGCLVAFMLGTSRPNNLILLLFLPSSAFGLTWNLINNVGMATGRYLYVEFLYTLLRSAHLLALALLPLYHNTILFSAIVFIIWILIQYIALSELGILSNLAGPAKLLGAAWAFLRSNWSMVKSSLSFMLLELLVYQYPMFFTMSVYGPGWQVVSVDTFYKLHRAANAFFRAVAESNTPSMVSARLDSDLARLKRILKRNFLFSIAPAAVGSAIFLCYFNPILHFILGNRSIVPAYVGLLVAIFIIIGSMESVATNYLLNSGQIHYLRNADLLSIPLLVLTTLATIFFKLGFGELMSLYVLSFACIAALKAQFGAQYYRASRPA
ncbi:hypothetical protein GALL_487440 [mine drainage metagenome]|uniref:Polysaccharide biosynthesis protein n=1 Tax=mine drainage metagenome TaxID=410659 RepID=A0A1J5Q1A0_9ZZZZ